MFKKIKAGKTSVTIPIRVYDSSSSTGGYLTSIAYDTAGLVGKYRREGSSAWTSITIVTATAGTFTSGGWAVPTSGPSGSYEIHVPDAAFASGAEWVEIEYSGVANMVPVQLFIELDAVDYQTAAFGAATPAHLPADFDTLTIFSGGVNVNGDLFGNNLIIPALATQAELDKVIKTGEERTITRDGKTDVTFTETRVP